MRPIDLIAVEYARRGVDFAAALERNYAEGFVYATPFFFVMGRAVARVEGGPVDAWFIEAMAGDTQRAWSILPWELPWIGFQRFDSDLRFYPIGTLRRLTTLNTHGRIT